MSPTIVLQQGVESDGTVATMLRAVAGASGGPRIISSVVHVLVNSLLLGRTAEDAVGLPRTHHQFLPNAVRYEDWRMLDGGEEIVPPSVVRGLAERGHVVEAWAKHGVCQLITQDLDTRTLHAVSDRRKSGQPAGYS